MKDGLTKADFDALVASLVAGSTWEEAKAPLAATVTDRALESGRRDVMAELHRQTTKRNGMRKEDIDRFAQYLADGLTWTQGKAKFPWIADAALEAHKTAIEDLAVTLHPTWR